jgi:transposase
MWTPTTRQQHSRPVTRYQTDLTDAEWRVIAPHLPKPRATGWPRAWPMREIVNGIFYVMRAGCPWRLLPKDLPPWGTIYRWFAVWRDDGRFERINHALVMADRERVGHDASPSAAIIDCQSAKTTEAGGPRGYDAGKKINGRKRHALVDTGVGSLVLHDFRNRPLARTGSPRARYRGTDTTLSDRSARQRHPSSGPNASRREAQEFPDVLLTMTQYSIRNAVSVICPLLTHVVWVVGDAPDFVEVGEAGIAGDDAMRRRRCLQLVG